jgi:hypothetical protein
MDTMMTKSLALLAALAALSAPAFAGSYGSNDRNCDQRASKGYKSADCYGQSNDEEGLAINSAGSDFDREQRRLDEKNDGNSGNLGGGGYN